MEVLAANLRFGGLVGAGEPLCERDVAAAESPSSSSSLPKLSFGVPALRFFFFGSSGGVESLY